MSVFLPGTAAPAYLPVPVPGLPAAMAPVPMPDSSRHSPAARAGAPSSHSFSVRLAYFSLAMYNAWILPGCQARPGGLACIALFILISHMIYGIPPAVPRDRGKPS